MDDLEERLAAAERRGILLMQTLDAISVKLGALEAIAVEFARTSDLSAADADRLMARLGAQYSQKNLPYLRKELLRLLHPSG